MKEGRTHERVFHNNRADYDVPIHATLSHESVRNYLAHIPNMKVMLAHLHRAVALARERAAKGQLPHIYT